jgi:hypothetical protein
VSNVPAGWYPNPEDSTLVRYWDGIQWTHDTAPAVAPQGAATSAPVFSPPPAPAAPAFAPTAPPAALISAGPTESKKKWLIGGAIVAGVLVVGSVGAAIGAGGNRDEAPQASVPPAAVETVEPAETTDAPTPAVPAAEAVDAVAFRAQAGSHLDDMQKDLNDIVTTVAEDGFWRLLSNSGELAFNQVQLEALNVPESVATTWPAALVALQASLDGLSDAIDTQDGPSILSAVEGVRVQVEASRGVVATAQ